MQKIRNVFCPNCGHEGYELKTEIIAENGITYEELVPVCADCGSWFYIDEVQQENIRRRRKALGLVSYEDVLRLPKKYGVPRDLLDIILDLNGVWEGKFPTEDESGRIEQALNNPKYFLERLDMAKNELPKARYEKIRARVVRMK